VVRLKIEVKKMDTRDDAKTPKLVDIDPNLKLKMKETLNKLAQHLIHKQPADPVSFKVSKLVGSTHSAVF